jgi:hypothetical protein
MIRYFAGKQELVEDVIFASEVTKDPLRWKAVLNRQIYPGSEVPSPSQLSALRGRYHTAMFKDNGGRIKMLMPLSAALLPFVTGPTFGKLAKFCIDQVLDPKNPYTAVVHVLYSKHVHGRFSEMLDDPSSVNYKSNEVATPRGPAYTYCVKGESHMFLSDIMPESAVLQRERNDLVRVEIDGNVVRWMSPPCTPHFVDGNEWTETDYGFMGQPNSKLLLKHTQYCVRVDDSGARKCVGREREDSAALECGACGHRMVDVHGLLNHAYTKELLLRISEFCYDEDVVAWVDDASIMIELLPYNAVVTIADGKMHLGASREFSVCDNGCKWTHGIRNAVLVEKSGESYIALFERILDSKRERKEYAYESVFQPDGKPSGVVYSCNLHLIKVHPSGTTVLPDSATAIWAYVNACVTYRRTSVALEVMPILQEFSRVHPVQGVVRLTENWPLILEAHEPKFHPLLQGSSDLSSSPPFEYINRDFLKLTAHYLCSGLSFSRNMLTVKATTYSKMAAGEAAHKEYECRASQAAMTWMGTNLKTPCAIGHSRSYAGRDDERETFKAELSKRGSVKSETPFPPHHFFSTFHPAIGHPLKSIISKPGTVAAQGFDGTARMADLMFYFIKGILPRPDQLSAVSAIREDLSTTRRSRGRIHPMLMGSGKTAVVTPLAIIESHYSGGVPGVCLVVPPPLLQQSAVMLARDVSPHCLIPLALHSDFKRVLSSGMCHVMEDGTHKALIIHRAGQPLQVRETQSKFSVIFDEVDTLINPLSSELNIPLDTPRQADTPLEDLFMLIYDHIQNGTADWRGVPAAVRDHFQQVVAPILASKRHRQHFGTATDEEAERAGKTRASMIAVPFAYADTPVVGSKYSDIVFSMACTARSYMGVRMHKSNVWKTIEAARRIAYDARVSGGCVKEYDPPAAVTRMLEFTGGRCFKVNDAEEVLDEWTAHDGIRRMFLRLVVAKEFVLEVDMHSATGMDMIVSGTCSSRTGFTGTPETLAALEKYDDDALLFLPKRPQDIASELAAMSRIGLAVFTGGFMRAFMTIHETRRRARVVIDCGCELVGFKPIEMFAAMLERFGTATRLVYWDKSGRPRVMSVHGDLPWDGVDDGELFVYYAHANTTGIDAKLLPGTEAVMTVGKDTRERDFMQALFRMRQIASSQTCMVAVAATVVSRMPSRTLQGVKDFIKANDEAYNRRQNEMIEGQCVLAKCRSSGKVVEKFEMDTFLYIMESVVCASSGVEGSRAMADRLAAAGMPVVSSLEVYKNSRGVSNVRVSTQMEQDEEQEEEREEEQEQDADISMLLRRAYTLDVLVRDISYASEKVPGFVVAGVKATRLACAYKHLRPESPSYIVATASETGEHVVALHLYEVANYLVTMVPRKRELAQIDPHLSIAVVSEAEGSRPLMTLGVNPPISKAVEVAEVLRTAEWPTVKTQTIS